MASQLYRLLSPCKSRLLVTNFKRTISSTLVRCHLEDVQVQDEFRPKSNFLTNDYIIVLPERLHETPENNEMLRIPELGDPETDYSTISVESLFKGVSQACCRFEDFIGNFENSPPKFTGHQDFFKLLEKELVPLDQAYAIMQLVLILRTSEFNYPEIGKLLERVMKCRDRRLKGTIYKYATIHLGPNYANMSADDRKMYKIYDKSRPFAVIQNLELESIDLLGSHLSKHIGAYNHKLKQANLSFSTTIDNPETISHILKEIGCEPGSHHNSRTPLRVTVGNYNKIMELCPDRLIRRNLWLAYNNRCSSMSDRESSTSIQITNIRTMRRQTSMYLGYSNYLDQELHKYMASSRQEILGCLNQLNHVNSPKVMDLLDTLNNFAEQDEQDDVADGGIMQYDVDFYKHRYKHEILIGTSEAELKKRFTYESVVNGIRRYFREYFDVDMRPNDQSKSKLWSETANMEQVFWKGKQIGSILHDPEGMSSPRSYQVLLRSKSSAYNSLPLISTLTSFDYQIGKMSSNCLDINQICGLFYDFSKTLQRLLHNYDYYELNLIGGLDKEMQILMPAITMQHMRLDPEIMQYCMISENSDVELSKKIVASNKFLRPLSVWQGLYVAHMDLESKGMLVELDRSAKDIYPLYSPFPRDSLDNEFLSNPQYIAGPETDLAYTQFWAERVADWCVAKQLVPSTKRASTSLDMDKVRKFNAKLLDELTNPDCINSHELLHSLTGERFHLS